MKRLNTIIFLCAICTSIFAQGINDLDKQTKKYLETAEKYIEDFHCDSVIKAYPIFNVFRKKEYRNKTFDKIPTLAELEQFLDFKHPVIDHVLVKTTDNKVWALIGKYKDMDYYAYIKGNKKDASFFEYLETLKPEKIYSLFGKGYLTFEKDGKRNLYNRKRQISDLPDIYNEYNFDLDHFNHYDFPRDQHTPLMIDYSKD
jgi:hypothetical protein